MAGQGNKRWQVEVVVAVARSCSWSDASLSREDIRYRIWWNNESLVGGYSLDILGRGS